MTPTQVDKNWSRCSVLFDRMFWMVRNMFLQRPLYCITCFKMTERNAHVPLEQIREYVQNKTYPNGYEGKFLLDILYLLLLLPWKFQVTIKRIDKLSSFFQVNTQGVLARFARLCPRKKSKINPLRDNIFMFLGPLMRDFWFILFFPNFGLIFFWS